MNDDIAKRIVEDSKAEPEDLRTKLKIPKLSQRISVPLKLKIPKLSQRIFVPLKLKIPKMSQRTQELAIAYILQLKGVGGAHH